MLIELTSLLVLPFFAAIIHLQFVTVNAGLSFLESSSLCKLEVKEFYTVASFTEIIVTWLLAREISIRQSDLLFASVADEITSSTKNSPRLHKVRHFHNVPIITVNSILGRCLLLRVRLSRLRLNRLWLCFFLSVCYLKLRDFVL